MSDSKLTALITALSAYGINLQPVPSDVPAPSLIESLSGKTILLGMTFSIVDKYFNVWSLGLDGLVLMNRVHAGNSANATLVSYYKGVVFHQNKDGNYYSWNYVTSAWQPDQSPIPAPLPATPIAQTPAGKLLSFLKNLKGRNAVSGQFVERGYMTSVDAITANTGQTVGMLGFDCFYYNAPLSFRADISWVPKAIDHVNKGGIIGLSLAMPNPDTGGGLADLQCDIGAMLTPGNKVNTNLNGILDDIAVGLKQLKDAGAPIICRFWHEHDGDWFFYGRQNASDAQIKQVFQYTAMYMNTKHQLDNILWCNGMNAGSATTNRVQGNVTDLIGIDGYTSQPANLKSDFDKFASSSFPLMLSEFGSGGPSGGDPAFDMMTLINQLKPGGSLNNVVAWLNWWDGNSGGPGWGMGLMKNTKAALNDPYVLNRGAIHL